MSLWKEFVGIFDVFLYFVVKEEYSIGFSWLFLAFVLVPSLY